MGRKPIAKLPHKKTVCQKMSRKHKNKESVTEENKQFDPGGKGGGSHGSEKWMYWYSFLFLGEVWAWMPGLFLVLLIVCLLCVVLEKIIK